MYLIEFFKRNARKSNIPTFIYLGMNVVFITFIVMMFVSGTVESDILCFLISFLLAIVIYALSLTIALSSIGEAILRRQTDCKRITDPNVEAFIRPIFNEVYERARAADPSIPEDVQLYYSEDESPNAFATGRRTVCVTRGMLDKPVDQIKATLGHEFGHLAHKDTDLVLVISVGNMIVDGIVVCIRVMVHVMQFFMNIAAIIAGGDEGIIAAFFTNISAWLADIFILGFMWVWNKIGTLLVMKSSRSNEFLADEFSVNLGYGPSLCNLLQSFGSYKSHGLFEALASSHPDNDVRIDRIHQLMNGTIARTYIGTSAPAPRVPQTVADQTMNAPAENNTVVDAGGRFRRVLTSPAPAAAAIVETPPAPAQTRRMQPAAQAEAANVIICSNCSAQLRAGSKFCPVCGTAVAAPVQESPRYCPHCGTAVTDRNAKFCSGCGDDVSWLWLD